ARTQVIPMFFRRSMPRERQAADNAGVRPYGGPETVEGDGRTAGPAVGLGMKINSCYYNYLKYRKQMKINKVMKRWIIAMVAMFVVLFSIDVCAQENERGVQFGGGADVVSGYIWRGVWEAGPSIQPTLVLSA